MIVKMKKVFLACGAAQRDALLENLRELGVVHLEPVEAGASVPEELEARLVRVQRAQQVLQGVLPSGEAPDVDVAGAVQEILEISRRADEGRTRLGALAREADRLAMWGGLRCEQLEAVQEAGVQLAFYSVDRSQADQVAAECVERLTELPGKKVLVAVVQRHGEPELPEGAQAVAPPARDLPTVRAEAKRLDAALAEGAARLAQLANLAEEIEQRRRRLWEEVQFARALSGAMKADEIFAIQGWAPAELAESLAADLSARSVEAAVSDRDPGPDETPPTLIRYPRWVRPIKGLFDILGTLPGYEERDLAPFFMIALPIFAAMLIGDTGYGLLFVLVPALLYRKAVAAAGKPGVHLLMVTGVVTVVWGLLTGAYFGVTPQNLLDAGGPLRPIGRALSALQVIHGSVKDQAYAIMKISFVMAAIHLSLAQVRQALGLAPSLAALGRIGWAVFLWGIFLLIWYLFFGSQVDRPPHWLTPYLLVARAPVGGPGSDGAGPGPAKRAGDVLGLHQLHPPDGRGAGQHDHRPDVQQPRGASRGCGHLVRRCVRRSVRARAEHCHVHDRHPRTRRATEYAGILQQCWRAMGRLPLQAFCRGKQQGALRHGVLRTARAGAGTGSGGGGQRLGHRRGRPRRRGRLGQGGQGR